MTGQPEMNALMGALLRRGRGPGRAAAPAEEAGDELAQIARRLGAVDVDAVRILAGEDAAGLSGAALQSRVVATLRGRSSWLAPTFEARFAALPNGISGGARGNVEVETPPASMTELLHAAVDLRRRGWA